ncbi:MAG: hypothetical protein M3044_04290 [Thermoproteota archaeon]|nr:hypothetical protein [Thermoproteota archaeon]
MKFEVVQKLVFLLQVGKEILAILLIGILFNTSTNNPAVEMQRAGNRGGK